MNPDVMALYEAVLVAFANAMVYPSSEREQRALDADQVFRAALARLLERDETLTDLLEGRHV